MTQDEQAAVWVRHSQQWSRVGPPLKPSAEDADITLRALTPDMAIQTGPCRVVVLGVTPELVGLPWPRHVQLFAFDHSARMIADVWSPNPSVPSFVQEADWRSLPLDSSSVHAAVGDGSLNALPGFDVYGLVLRELHRVMAPDALLVLRCFIRPEQAEDLPAIQEAVEAGAVGSFHALKWRLAMSLAAATDGCVAVADIHAAFESLFPDRSKLSNITGWAQAQIDTIDAYRAAPTRYTFPTLQGMRAYCAPWFDVQAVQYAHYELAERCPTLTFRRQGSTGAVQ
ncbi:MAG: hypothetical protein E6Q49_04540 [Limnohabitans sp.]|nr:MAG: hypothetical protein E6Q49_04540 [Limnohabitans sp.]